MRAVILLLAAVGCASASEPVATRAPARPISAPTAARLTGGVGNHVVQSFDELREAVSALQGPIDACWRATESEPGWRETLVWELQVDRERGVTAVRVVPAEFWREGKVVSGAPGPALDRCMTATLQRLPIRARESGTVRVRFEPL